jgi:hypothetical protein
MASENSQTQENGHNNHSKIETNAGCHSTSNTAELSPYSSETALENRIPAFGQTTCWE